MLLNTYVGECARTEVGRGGSRMGRGRKQTHSSGKGHLHRGEVGAAPRQPCSEGSGTGRPPGFWEKGQGSAREPARRASLLLHQPHELADVPGEQLRLLEGSKVAPTGHVGVGDEFRVLDLHPLLRGMQ